MPRLLSGHPRSVAVLLLLALAVLVSPARAAEQAIFIAPLDTPGIVTVRVIIPYTAEKPGLAHFMEHLVWHSAFRGKVKLAGPHHNAFTLPGTVVYELSGPPSELNDTLRTLARVFEPIRLERDFAIAERGVVRREYDFRLTGKPNLKALEAMQGFLYAGNAIANSVMGTPDEIEALRIEDAMALQEATHRPERAVLMAGGDITAEQLSAALAAVKFPAMRPRASLQPVPFTLAPPVEKVFAFPEDAAAPRMLLCKVVELPEPVSYELLYIQSQLLRDILLSGLQGGLAKPLRLDNFIARTFELSFNVHDERHAEFCIFAEPDAGIGFAALREAVEGALAESAKGIPQATFARVLKRLRAAWPDPSDRPANLEAMSQHMFDRLLFMRVPLDEAGSRALMDQLEPRAVDRLIAAVAGPGRTAISLIGKDPAP